jgi:hypothetical protein
MAVKSNSPVANLPKIEPIKTNDLWLDPQNPRLVGEGLSIDDQDKIVSLLWKERSVNELVDSIAASGFWPHEVLLVVMEGDKSVVIEGNRRLAAVKILTDKALRERIGVLSVPELSQDAKDKLMELPAVRCTRKDVWQYIGFKHVNGPQDWDSIAKAQYVARINNQYHIPLDDIARNIGDRHDTVIRLYRGLMVLNQAEESGVFKREDRWKTRFAYSHLWTGLGYSGVQEFIGITPEKSLKPNPVPKAKLSNLGQLCLWLYGSKLQKQRPIVESQNPDLRNLDEVLRSKQGIASLRAGLPLDTSLKASRGDERLLREALAVAEDSLRSARGLVVTGYSGDTDSLKTANAIYLLADSIHKEMEEISAEQLAKSAKSAKKSKKS